MVRVRPLAVDVDGHLRVRVGAAQDDERDRDVGLDDRVEPVLPVDEDAVPVERDALPGEVVAPGPHVADEGSDSGGADVAVVGVVAEPLAGQQG